MTETSMHITKNFSITIHLTLVCFEILPDFAIVVISNNLISTTGGYMQNIYVNEFLTSNIYRYRSGINKPAMQNQHNNLKKLVRALLGITY